MCNHSTPVNTIIINLKIHVWVCLLGQLAKKTDNMFKETFFLLFLLFKLISK
jgi:hypothetical protein